MYVCICTFIVVTFAYDLSQLPNQEDTLCMCVFLVVTYAYNLSQLPTIIQCPQISISSLLQHLNYLETNLYVSCIF